MPIVRCPTCLRMERWNAHSRESVVQQGGNRQPQVHRSLAAWRILYAAHRGQTGPVVGLCSMCELPVVADDGGPEPMGRLELDVPGGTAVITDTVQLPQGSLDWTAANDWFEAQFRSSIEVRPVGWALEAAMMSAASLPIAAWFLAISVLVFFYWGMAEGYMDIPE